LWDVSKALHIPIDGHINKLQDIPYTISFVIKKQIQLDNLNELPKEKRPPEKLFWDGSSTELESFFDTIFNRKTRRNTSTHKDMLVLDIDESMIEG